MGPPSAPPNQTEPKPQSQNKPSSPESDSSWDHTEETEDSEISDEEAHDTKWLASNHKMLTAKELGKLSKAFEKLVATSDYIGTKYPDTIYYCFAHRVCKAYAHFWNKTKGDEFHTNRKGIAGAAVSNVYGQIRPRNSKPHSGTI